MAFVTVSPLVSSRSSTFCAVSRGQRLTLPCAGPKRSSISVRTAIPVKMDLLSLFTKSKNFGPPVVIGDESIMSKKSHGTCVAPVQENLRYGVDRDTADKISCYNRHFAEFAGYFKRTTWLNDVPRDAPTEYFDSVTGKRLFTAPIGRTMDEFEKESAVHGWPSFRDDEVDWENVRVLPNGECVSVDGTHLGHNLPDSSGNRYCINLVCIAGNPDQ